MLTLRHAGASRGRDLSLIALPIRILLALRGAPDPEIAFNAVGVVRRLLGRHGDERASKVLLPFVWARSASDEELRAFIDAPWVVPSSTWTADEDIARTGSGRTIDQLRIADFPGTGTLAAPAPAHPVYDLIHFAGRLHQENGDVMLALDAAASLRLAAGALRDALIAVACRLLILQVREDDRSRAEQ